jgi:excisionase family DNA binding protein
MSQPTVRALVRAGVLNARRVGRTIGITESSVDRFIAGDAPEGPAGQPDATATAVDRG